MATGSRGGASKPNIFDAKKPPGNALLAKEVAAQKRQDAGLNPTASPVHAAGRAVHALVHGTGQPASAGFGGAHINAPTAFTPVTLGLSTLLDLPKIVGSAHHKAVALAHPSAANPPSLGREVDALLSGSLGVPRLGVNEPKKHPMLQAPKIPKGTATEATGGELGQQVREGLRGAKAARTQQDKLYSAERGSRAAAADEAMKIGGQEGYHAALSQLKGELPKLKFGGFEHFDQNSLDALFTHIQEHPTLRPFEKIRTQTALRNLTQGKVPTKSELGLLGHVFGKETSLAIAKSVTTFQKAKQLGIDLLNVPRSIMSSFDLSAPFRQGLVTGAGHPRIFFKNFAPMVKTFGSEKVYQGVMDDIASRPNFQKMQESGLALTDLENVSQREEQFASNLAEHIPIVGRGIRGSGRAYVAFLTKTRADVFDSLLKTAEGQGLDTSDPKLLKSISQYVNSATGRGDLGALREHAVSLNTLFFSPRLLASRVNFLNPVYYAKLDPFARKQAMKSMASLVSAVGLTLYLAKLGGAEVNADPRNADFGKIKIGNTRLDILGGFQQPIRLMAQLFSGKIVSSTTGKTLSLGPQGPGKLSRFDIAQRFVESKLAPVPSFVKDVGKGVDSVGQPLDWGLTKNNPAFQRMLPLLVQDATDLYREKGLVPAIGGYAIGGLGIGLQTYKPKQPKTAKQGGNIFDQSPAANSGSTGKNIFDK